MSRTKDQQVREARQRWVGSLPPAIASVASTARRDLRGTGSRVMRLPSFCMMASSPGNSTCAGCARPDCSLAKKPDLSHVGCFERGICQARLVNSCLHGLGRWPTPFHSHPDYFFSGSLSALPEPSGLGLGELCPCLPSVSSLTVGAAAGAEIRESSNSFIFAASWLAYSYDAGSGSAVLAPATCNG